MMPDSGGPFSRPIPTHRISAGGITETVEADADERAALARDLDLPAVHALVGRYRLTGSGRRVRVVGRIEAEIEQICTLTLEPFRNSLCEDVEVEFEEPRDGRGGKNAEDEVEADLDLPDELVGDRVDLGAITAEFLSLGLDPYPRKPGAVFATPDEGSEAPSPFAKLAALRPDRTDEA